MKKWVLSAIIYLVVVVGVYYVYTSIAGSSEVNPSHVNHQG